MASDTLDLPVIELSHWLNRTTSAAEAEIARSECERVADSLFKYGLLIVRDPRATQADNDVYVPGTPALCCLPSYLHIDCYDK
jgi:hypothetical protein